MFEASNTMFSKFAFTGSFFINISPVTLKIEFFMLTVPLTKEVKKQKKVFNPMSVEYLNPLILIKLKLVIHTTKVDTCMIRKLSSYEERFPLDKAWSILSKCYLEY